MKTETADVLKTYPFRNIPGDLKRRVTAKGVLEGKSFRDVLLMLMKEYVRDFDPLAEK